MSLSVIILAAGMGTRMRSATPKVLHELAGRSLLGTLRYVSGRGPELFHAVSGVRFVLMTARRLVSLFRRIYGALCPGGLLLFDVAEPGRVPGSGSSRTFVEGEGWAVHVAVEGDRRRAGPPVPTRMGSRRLGHAVP